MDTNTPQQRKLTAILEGLLFLAGEEGLSLLQMQSVLEDCSQSQIEELLKALGQSLDEQQHGFELAKYAGRYKLVSREFVYGFAQKLFEQTREVSLSNAAMETLAIIAYKQPVTRVEIEEIRGVGCETILKKLQQRDLIEARERSNAVGNPLLYTVTDTFLDAFALETVEELPKIKVRSQQEGLFEDTKSEV